MEYSKGKWGVTKWDGGHGFNVFTDDGFIASVPMEKGLKHTMREAQANAHLIAQSPRMAEWLKRVITQGGWVYQKDLDEAKEIITKVDNG